MATINLGRVGFVNKGTWSVATAYKINDVVIYNNGTYAALQAHTGQTPITGGSVYWQEWITSDNTAFVANAIHSATNKATPVDADELGIADSAATFALKKLTWANLKATLGSLFAPLASPTFTGAPTAPNFSYKPTPVTITSWSYVTTTITINVASHTFVSGDYIEVSGLTATTNIPNGVHLVTSVTATTIVFTYALTPTGTAGVSSATVKGYTTINGRTNGIGEGQTWQDVTASRAATTTYTNTTGKPMQVFIVINANGPGVRTLTIGSVTFPINLANATGASAVHTNIVPAGSTYSYDSTFSKWVELR